MQYPIGKFRSTYPYTTDQIVTFIKVIEEFPDRLKKKVTGLNSKDLLKTYREGGWNVRQLVHHLADSHMNSFIRFKLALTEENPTIKPYLEAKWADMDDVSKGDVGLSLDILHGVHARWVILLRGMKAEDYDRTFQHPESGRDIRLATALAIYAWHCNHHFAHVEICLNSEF